MLLGSCLNLWSIRKQCLWSTLLDIAPQLLRPNHHINRLLLSLTYHNFVCYYYPAVRKELRSYGYPYSLYSVLNGEPVGATNRVSQLEIKLDRSHHTIARWAWRWRRLNWKKMKVKRGLDRWAATAWGTQTDWEETSSELACDKSKDERQTMQPMAGDFITEGPGAVILFEVPGRLEPEHGMTMASMAPRKSQRFFDVFFKVTRLIFAQPDVSKYHWLPFKSLNFSFFYVFLYLRWYPSAFLFGKLLAKYMNLWRLTLKSFDISNMRVSWRG